MQWLYNQVYRHQFYKITKEGDQLSMLDNSPAEYILHIQHEDKLRYHFIQTNYELTVPYTVLGMSVTIRDQPYLLPADQFIVRDNELFTETLTLWLCKHYLRIKPCHESTVTLIDENADIQVGTLCVVQNNLKNDIKCIF